MSSASREEWTLRQQFRRRVRWWVAWGYAIAIILGLLWFVVFYLPTQEAFWPLAEGPHPLAVSEDAVEGALF